MNSQAQTYKPPAHHEFELRVADGAGEDWAESQADAKLQFVTQLLEELLLEVCRNSLPGDVSVRQEWVLTLMKTWQNS